MAKVFEIALDDLRPMLCLAAKAEAVFLAELGSQLVQKFGPHFGKELLLRLAQSGRTTGITDALISAELQGMLKQARARKPRKG